MMVAVNLCAHLDAQPPPVVILTERSKASPAQKYALASSTGTSNKTWANKIVAEDALMMNIGAHTYVENYLRGPL